jgi:hypothetical protein
VIVPVAALLVTVVPLLLGGRLGRFAVLRLRSAEVAAGAFWVQLAALELLPGPRPLLGALHVGSYVAAAAFVVVNRRVPGLWLVGLGGLSNGATIALNGGTLPASPSALAHAGLPDDAGFANSGIVETPVLPGLGDVFAVPAGWPLANVFSVGDVLLVLGAGWASLRICGTRWTAPWDARRHGHERGRHLGPAPLPPRPPARRVACGDGRTAGGVLRRPVSASRTPGPPPTRSRPRSRRATPSAAAAAPRVPHPAG